MTNFKTVLKARRTLLIANNLARQELRRYTQRYSDRYGFLPNHAKRTTEYLSLVAEYNRTRQTLKRFYEEYPPSQYRHEYAVEAMQHTRKVRKEMKDE